jgi:hypothetical protein
MIGRSQSFVLLLVSVCAIACPPPNLLADFTITLDFRGNWDPSQRTAVQESASFWESLIVGYRPTASSMSGITIAATGYSDSGSGQLGGGNISVVQQESGFVFATQGYLELNTAYFPLLDSYGLLNWVIKHEMAHAMGFGTLWIDNGLYVQGSGQYLGTNGVREYRGEFSNTMNVNYVPVELAGPPGTSNLHWEEIPFGDGLTGRVDSSGRDMTYELMTGWFNLGQTPFVSRTTLGQFEDLGYIVNYSAVPEPSTLLLGLVVIACRASMNRFRYNREK